MTKSKFKRSKWQPGMVYAIPLIDGSFCYAQAIAAVLVTVIDIAVFKTKSDSIPTVIPNLTLDQLISYSATWAKSLNNGDWCAIGVRPTALNRLDFPNQKLLEIGTTIGVKHSDLGLLTELCNAWHGLIPWNVMLKEDYYDSKLAPGVHRPQSALVLSKDEREIFRSKN